MEFRILHQSHSSQARICKIRTLHGEFTTPVFIPVGTQGTVKAVCSRDLEELGVEILLVNTYHLYLRPGHSVIKEIGGIHSFMGWNGPVLSDSGGFQIYSLADLAEIGEEGVKFRSHIDGSIHLLTPEKAVEIQEALGADIIMCLDHCIPYTSQYDKVARSVEITTKWALRSIKRKMKNGQALFGIIQGGTFWELRERSITDLLKLDFDGYAIGGLCVGEEDKAREEIVKATALTLPKDRPIYLMGIGRPDEIVDAVSYGVDMFDCVLPTRNARNGTLFTWEGKINIRNARYREDQHPIEEDCSCYTCSRYSRAYLRHLFNTKELLAYRLSTIHNLSFFCRFMQRLREAIKMDKLDQFRNTVLKIFG